MTALHSTPFASILALVVTMALRRGHGRGAGQPRVEVQPPDEQPQPVAAPIAAPRAPLVFREDGRIGDRQTAKVMQARSVAARRDRARLVSALGLSELASDCAFAPYRSAGDDFVREHLASLALQAGGVVGPGPSSIVASAGLQLAASRFLADRGAASGDAVLLGRASALANDSRQNLLAAYELAVREAKARAERTPVDAYAHLVAALAEPNK